MTNELLPNHEAFLPPAPYDREALHTAVAVWASSNTSLDSPRRADMLRDKSRAVLDFFQFTKKAPAAVRPQDIVRWQIDLQKSGLASETIYNYISRVSSFYRWLQQDPQLAEAIPGNPVDLARPKRNPPYSSKQTQPWTVEEITTLVEHVKKAAAVGGVNAKRDYALLLLYLTTGLHRREIIQLRAGDVQFASAGLTITVRMNTGKREIIAIDAAPVAEALNAYMVASGREGKLADDEPIWRTHDRAGTSGRKPVRGRTPNSEGALSSHGFVKNLKRYAKAAGLGEIHLQQTRHSFAALISEDAEDVSEVQEALHLQQMTTTRSYLDRIIVQQGKFSRRIAEKLKLL